MELNMDGWGANEKYPHALGEPATSINRWYLKLKSELMPYAYSIAKEAVDGMPMIRAMFLEYPNAYTQGTATQYQYLYGPYFLVAPIYQATKADEQGNDIRNGIYLPEGVWIDYFTGEKYDGNRILNNFAAPLWKLPVFVKNGAIIPLTNPDGALLSQKGVNSAPQNMRKNLIALNRGSTDFSLWKANGRGVDPNVNFDARWGEGVSNVFAAGSENYVGEAPFSEPESRALKAFTEEIFPQYTLSFHTKGEEIYWRFSQTGMRTYRDYALAKALSASTGYPLGDASDSCGGYKDWCVEALSVPAFTIETGREEAAHPLKEAELKDIVKKCGNAVYDLSLAVKNAHGTIVRRK